MRTWGGGNSKLIRGAQVARNECWEMNGYIPADVGYNTAGNKTKVSSTKFDWRLQGNRQRGKRGGRKNNKMDGAKQCSTVAAL